MRLYFDFPLYFLIILYVFLPNLTAEMLNDDEIFLIVNPVKNIFSILVTPLSVV